MAGGLVLVGVCGLFERVGLLDGGAECPCGCLPQQPGQLGGVRRDDEQLDRDSAPGVERAVGVDVGGGTDVT